MTALRAMEMLKLAYMSHKIHHFAQARNTKVPLVLARLATGKASTVRTQQRRQLNQEKSIPAPCARNLLYHHLDVAGGGIDIVAAALVVALWAMHQLPFLTTVRAAVKALEAVHSTPLLQGTHTANWIR